MWTTSQSLAVKEADQTTWTLQARAATARFERDLRLAGAGGASYAAPGAIVSGASSQVVFLLQSEQADVPLLVEWEIVNGSLMRRWGWCPASRPSTFAHSLYVDNKTMLERVDTSQSAFFFEVAGARVSAPLPEGDAPMVSAVGLQLCARADGVGHDWVVSRGRVGR